MLLALGVGVMDAQRQKRAALAALEESVLKKSEGGSPACSVMAPWTTVRVQGRVHVQLRHMMVLLWLLCACMHSGCWLSDVRELALTASQLCSHLPTSADAVCISVGFTNISRAGFLQTACFQYCFSLRFEVERRGLLCVSCCAMLCHAMLCHDCALRSTGNTLEGFGIVTLASLLPVLAVELMAVITGAM